VTLTCKQSFPLNSPFWSILTFTQMLASCREQRMLNVTGFLPRVDAYAHIHAHALMFLFHWTLPLEAHHIPLIHLLSSTPCLCPESHGNSHTELYCDYKYLAFAVVFSTTCFPENKLKHLFSHHFTFPWHFCFSWQYILHLYRTIINNSCWVFEILIDQGGLYYSSFFCRFSLLVY